MTETPYDSSKNPDFFDPGMQAEPCSHEKASRRVIFREQRAGRATSF
jgi:hypothetical protein